jgi:hypothetical protein
MSERWKPERGETYFIISAYAADPYEHVWQGDKGDLGRFKYKVLYRTREEALNAKRPAL